MASIYNKTLSFINDWKESNENIESCIKKVSVVINVYHPSHLKEVLEHLSKLDYIYEVIIVFDSHDDDPNLYVDNYNFNLILIQHDKNRNAAGANNTGAVYATGELILFLNQDMILSPDFIPNALKLLKSNDYNALILGFRDTLDFEDIPTLENWTEANYNNDWRINTTINEKFLDLTVSNCGSIENNCKNNSSLKIYKRSNKFRTLGTTSKSTIGFWDLPSMVISHSLMIPKKEFIDIGGFPEWIKGWGGEDIAMGFLAVSKHLFIIPTEVGSYHIKHSPHSGSEEKKWNEMKENLKKYKIWSKSIDEYSSINEEEIRNRSKIIYEKKYK